MHMSHIQRERAALHLKSNSKVSFKSRRPTNHSKPYMGLPPAQMTVALGCTEKTDPDPLFRSNREMLFRSIRKCHKGYFFHSWRRWDASWFDILLPFVTLFGPNKFLVAWKNWVYSWHLLVFLFHLLLLCKTSSFCWFYMWNPKRTASSPLITHFPLSYLAPSKSHAQAKHFISELFFFRRFAVLSSHVLSACSSPCSMDMWHEILYSLCFTSFSIIECAALKMIFFFLQFHWAFGMDIMEITVWFLDPIPPG